VHRVRLAAGAGGARTQQPLVGSPPYTTLLGAGRSLDVDGWHIAVQAADAHAARVAITPAGG